VVRSYPRAYFEILSSAFTLIMGMSLLSAFLPIFAKKLDPSEVLIGLVSSAWYIPRLFTEMPSGMLSDRFGRRRLLVIGLGLSAIGAFICLLANTIQVLILGRAIWGLGASFFFMSSSALIFDLFKSSRRGRALGTFQAIEFIGSLIGAPIGSFMASAFGYKEVFFLSSLLILSSFLISIVSRGLRMVHAENPKRAETSYFSEVLPSFKRRGLTVVYSYSFSRMLITAGISGTVFPLYVNFNLGIPVELIGVIVSIRTLGIIIATLISGYVSDIFGRKPVVILGTAFQSICLYAYTATSSYEGLLAIGFFEGLSRGMLLTSIMVLLSDFAPPRSRGAAIGIYRTFMDIGGLTGPILFIILFDKMGASFTFISAMLVLLLNLALMLTVRTPRNLGEKGFSETKLS